MDFLFSDQGGTPHPQSSADKIILWIIFTELEVFSPGSKPWIFVFCKGFGWQCKILPFTAIKPPKELWNGDALHCLPR